MNDLDLCLLAQRLRPWVTCAFELHWSRPRPLQHVDGGGTARHLPSLAPLAQCMVEVLVSDANDDLGHLEDLLSRSLPLGIGWRIQTKHNSPSAFHLGDTPLGKQQIPSTNDHCHEAKSAMTPIIDCIEEIITRMTDPGERRAALEEFLNQAQGNIIDERQWHLSLARLTALEHAGNTRDEHLRALKTRIAALESHWENGTGLEPLSTRIAALETRIGPDRPAVTAPSLITL